MDATTIINKLFKYFDVTKINKLAEKLEIEASALSAYKHRNAINCLHKICIQRGIYSEIFNPTDNQTKEIENQIILLNNPEVMKLLNIVNTMTMDNDANLENFTENIRNWVKSTI